MYQVKVGNFFLAGTYTPAEAWAMRKELKDHVQKVKLIPVKEGVAA